MRMPGLCPILVIKIQLEILDSLLAVAITTSLRNGMTDRCANVRPHFNQSKLHIHSSDKYYHISSFPTEGRQL